MTRITLTPELLHSPIAKVNVFNFYNPLEDLSALLDDALMAEEDHYHDDPLLRLYSKL